MARFQPDQKILATLSRRALNATYKRMFLAPVRGKEWFAPVREFEEKRTFVEGRFPRR